jgi:hypothetical protein
MNISEASQVKAALILCVTAILFSVVSLYLTLWILKVRILGRNNLKFNDGLLFPILALGSLIGVGIIVSGVIPSISSTLKVLSQTGAGGFWSQILTYVALCSMIIFAGVVVINFLTTFLFQSLFAKVELKDEVAGGKLAYPLLFVGIFIGLSLCLKEVFVVLSELFIPYP